MTEFHYCLVWEMKHDGRLPPLGKHEEHLPHYWWYIKGGHQMNTAPLPGDIDYNRSKKWICPGRGD